MKGSIVTACSVATSRRQKHEVVSHNSVLTLKYLSLNGSGGQHPAQTPLVAAPDAFDLPAVAINRDMEVLLHLAAILGLGPLLALVAFVQGDHRGTDTKGFPR